MVAAALARNGVRADVHSIGLTDIPACGTNAEVLAASRPRRLLDCARGSLMYPHQVLHWIDDAEVASAGSSPGVLAVREAPPVDDSVLAQVARGGAADVARAVDVAAAAADTWGRLPAAQARRDPRTRGRAAARERARVRRVHPGGNRQAVEERRRPKWRRPPISASSWRAKAAASTARRCRVRFRIGRCEPCARRSASAAPIMPFNSPLAGIAWKVFPALLCGNAVVAKSHELTPYTAVAFGKLLRKPGLPRGRVFGRAGPRSRSRHAARARRTRRPRQLHRVGRDRQADSEDRQRTHGAREGLPRTRRQEPARRLRRCRRGAGGGARGGLRVRRRRAAVRVGQPPHRVPARLRRLP